MARITRKLAVGAVAALSIGAVGATTATANANGSHHHRGGAGGFSITRSAASTLDTYDVDLEWGTARHARAAHDGNRGRGTLTFDGADTDVTWSRIRINERRNKVTAVVDGERVAVLKFRDTRGTKRTVLRLTDAGADSIDKAAGADAFDAGDAFAKKSHRHYRHHR